MVQMKFGMMSYCLSGTAFLAIVALCAATDAVQAADPQPASRCEVVAHRGFSAIAPENTISSAVKAMEAGADGSEFDVYPSSDGVLVIMHDNTVDRTTNGKGKVTELSLAEIKKLDAGSKMSSKFAGEPVPTLDEMLAKLKGTPCKPVIEIKGHNIADQVLAAVRKAEMVDHAVIECFDRDVIRQIRVQEPRLPCAWLCSETPKEIPPEQQADWIFSQAKECNTNFVSLRIKMLSAQRVAELHDRKMIVWVWTVDLPSVVKEVMAWGVDGIETNRPNVVRLLVDAAKKPG